MRGRQMLLKNTSSPCLMRRSCSKSWLTYTYADSVESPLCPGLTNFGLSQKSPEKVCEDLNKILAKKRHSAYQMTHHRLPGIRHLVCTSLLPSLSDSVWTNLTWRGVYQLGNEPFGQPVHSTQRSLGSTPMSHRQRYIYGNL